MNHIDNIEAFRQVTNGDFSLRPDGELGAVDTAHGVFFGRLNAREVAVKAHDSERDAAHEAHVLKVVRDIGIPTVQPVRIIPCPRENGAFLVTDRIPGLTSAASLPFVGPVNQVQSTTESVTDIAQTLGTLHGHGISHGDAQLKNFGLIRDQIDRRTNRPQVVVYDTEKGGTETDGHIKSHPYGHDLDSLTQSLAHKGFGGTNLDVAAAALEAWVLEPYYKEATTVGLEESTATEAVTTAYGAFLDVRARLTYAASHTGHCALTHVS